MYKIPSDFNSERLCGQTITQICYGINTISIMIDIGYIGFEGSFVFKNNGERVEVDEIYPAKDWGLLNLLEKKITNIEIDSERTILTLHVEDNMLLSLIGTPFYESFSVKIDGKEFIV